MFDQRDIDAAEKFRRGTGGKYDRDVENLSAAFAAHRLAAETATAARIAEESGWTERGRRWLADGAPVGDKFAEWSAAETAARIEGARMAIEAAAVKARTLYLFPKPKSRATQYHERNVQDAISDAIRKLDPQAIVERR